jgi:hypothetical protein
VKPALGRYPLRFRTGADGNLGLEQMRVTARHSTVKVFLFPAIIALSIACGLLSALLGDNMWDAVSWVALAFPLAVIALCFWDVRLPRRNPTGDAGPRQESSR